MEAPTNFGNEKDKEMETCINFVPEGESEEYAIKMTQSQESESISFLISIKDSLRKYQQEVSLKTFTSNKAFAQAENLDDIYEVLLSHLQEKNFTLKKEEEKIILKFEFKILKKSYNFEIDVNLIKRKMTDSLMNEILEENKQMKKEINNLKQENIEINKKLEELKNLNRYKLLARHSFYHRFDLFESIGNKRVAINSRDKKYIEILDIFSGMTITRFSVDKAADFNSVINMRDEYLIAGTEDKIFVWEFKSRKLLKILDPAVKKVYRSECNTKVVLLENDLFASKSQSELIIFIWNVNHYTPLKQINLNSESLPIPGKNDDFFRNIWDMIKYSDGYLAVVYGMGGSGRDKCIKIFSIIDYNSGEVKSSFNFKEDYACSILKFNNDKLILRRGTPIYISDPMNSIYQNDGIFCHESFLISLDNNIFATCGGSYIFIKEVSNQSKLEIIKKLNHDEYYWAEDYDTKQLKQHSNGITKVILVDDEYIVSTDYSNNVFVWLN